MIFLLFKYFFATKLIPNDYFDIPLDENTCKATLNFKILKECIETENKNFSIDKANYHSSNIFYLKNKQIFVRISKKNFDLKNEKLDIFFPSSKKQFIIKGKFSNGIFGEIKFLVHSLNLK